jgi:hypothetical protein
VGKVSFGKFLIFIVLGGVQQEGMEEGGGEAGGKRMRF